jgi:D-alanyl-D-alanine carboxypeptidase (penicillin-binding protein 5/6)
MMMDNLEQKNNFDQGWLTEENLKVVSDSQKKEFVVAGIKPGEWLLAILSVLLLVFLFSKNEVLPNDDFFYNQANVVGSQNVSQAENPFLKLDIKAKSAYVLDINSGEVLFEKDSEVQLPLTSLTKIMTAVTALSMVPESTIISVEKEDLALEGDSGLYANEKWRLQDLLNLVLIESSNDGAYTVASGLGEIFVKTGRENGRKFFINSMNQKAKDLGLAQTYFNNESGLDESEYLSGGYGSAKDVAVLIGKAVKDYPDVFRNTKYDEMKLESLSNLKHKTTNTNKTINSIPGVIASKTGYTNLAGGNLAVVFDAGFGRPISVVVLGSTYEDRFLDVENLTMATLEYLNNK